MNQHELTARLHSLHVKKRDFAEMLGLQAATVYHWKATPRYVEELLRLMDRVQHLEGNMFRNKESAKAGESE